MARPLNVYRDGITGNPMTDINLTELIVLVVERSSTQQRIICRA